MSTLVIQIPQRQRLRAQRAAEAPPTSDEYAYVTSPDGLSVLTHGSCAPALLPKATTTIAVLADADVSWHRITLPKAPAARMRAALEGVLEDGLLEDTDSVHFALAPQAKAGNPTWVAVVDRAWLRHELAALEGANVFVDRIAPMAWPEDPPSGHFAESGSDAEGGTRGIALHWAHGDGVASVRLQGGLARALVPTPPPEGTRWSATPGAAAAAEQWLGAPVQVLTPAQRLLQGGRSPWNLRQFDLARRTRGDRAVTDALRALMSPEWRWLRYGAIALVAVQVISLNVWAWHQNGVIRAKRTEMQKLVQATYPKANPQDIQRDPQAVMQREAQSLRTLAGQPGDDDLETLLQAAAYAWPPGRPPVETVRFEPGKLTVAANGWSAPQIEQFRNTLRPAGWQVDATTEGRLTLSRAAAATGPRS
ncbi:MAG: general secretion pathway protein GspL [Proteobacteria bacterium]|nr:general secretion pathway protein GspL [Pseudomonadota bacterium]